MIERWIVERNKLVDIVEGKSLILKKELRKWNKVIIIIGKDKGWLRIGLINKEEKLGVDDMRGILRNIMSERKRMKKEELLMIVEIGKKEKIVGIEKMSKNRKGKFSGMMDIGGRKGSDVLIEEFKILRKKEKNNDRKERKNKSIGRRIKVELRKMNKNEERKKERNDGRIMERVGIGEIKREDGMKGIMIGGISILLRSNGGKELRKNNDIVIGIIELMNGKEEIVEERGNEGGLVEEVGKIGKGEERSKEWEKIDIKIGWKRKIEKMKIEDMLEEENIRVRKKEMKVEKERKKERRIKKVGKVGGRNKDDRLIGLKKVNIEKKMIESMLEIVIEEEKKGEKMKEKRIDLIDEDNEGRIIIGMLKNIEEEDWEEKEENLKEVRKGNGEERKIGLERKRKRKKSIEGEGRE